MPWTQQWDKIGISVIDVTTGDYFVTQVDDKKKLFDEIIKFSPAEIVCNDSFLVSGFDLDDLRSRLGGNSDFVQIDYTHQKIIPGFFQRLHV